jgi:hypothetical protein
MKTRMTIALAVTCGIVFSSWASAAPYRVWNDPGGIITNHEIKYRRLTLEGRQIQILGYCASACTLVLAYVPRNRVCVGPKAVLGFHQASEPGTKPKTWVRSEDGTKYLYWKYDAAVRKWIDSKGGLTEKMLWLRGKELRKHVRPCS